jgi:hypothetical protein
VEPLQLQVEPHGDVIYSLKGAVIMADSKTIQKDVKYEILNNIGIISRKKGGWQKELNILSWNGREPQYDLRNWSPDHARMGKGITLSEEELRELYRVIGEELKVLDNLSTPEN